ncbi:MAG: hypothetical protein M1833_004459 [Piccolia ochrophora]|nr:MAG: hypothetical protein M1833_004459 [Piccolia ochrophora]
MPPPHPSTTHIRSLYRSFLRELPLRPTPSAAPSPLRIRLRESFSPRPATTSNTQTSSTPSSTPGEGQNQLVERVQQAEQFLGYVRAQRTYVALLERYNPGITMGEEERLSATARRVGLEMPDEGGREGDR